MPLTTATIGTYLLDLVLSNWLWIVLIILVFALPAPYYALKLIRRNRCLGRNIYCELALADRFMDVWNAASSLASGGHQYHWAFVPNQNRAAAQLMQIDARLAEWKLVRRFPLHGGYGSPDSMVTPMYGKYWLRNWLIYLLLLWLRVTIFGDCFSHIVSGSGKYNEKVLKRMYWMTTGLLCLLPILIAVVGCRYL